MPNHRSAPDAMSAKNLAGIAIDEITRRLTEHEDLHKLVSEYETAIERAAQLIDFATDRKINPADYTGEIRRMLHEHQVWIEKQRTQGKFPALHGTKPPVARPKRKRRTR